ncbi:MAG: alpha/beta hydrolase [Gaiellaceae bacterium]
MTALTPIRRRGVEAATALLVVAFVAVGALGTYRYLDNFWLYRGFSKPRDPAFVRLRGTTVKIAVASPALGGRRQTVYVYLPPGYAEHPARRYPVLYLLHGVPGRPKAFLETVRAGVDQDILVAEHRMRPMILVMPFGSTGTFTDEEWANGWRQGNGWETFVARDLVRSIDSRYRTIRRATARGIGGLSEGGYGAINIALHHPREFSVVESWSGYELADNIPSIFDRRPRLLALNSPKLTLPRQARTLRRRHVYFWFYTGTGDRMSSQNVRFARELTRYHIAHSFFLLHGGHDWSLWRGNAESALVAADRHFSYARSLLAAGKARR